MRQINLALIGASEWAQCYHLPAIKYLESRYSLHITGIWNRTTRKAVEMAQRFQIKKIYNTLNDVLDDRDITCFSVVMHPSALMEILPKLLTRNLPILCEKPPGQTFEETKALSSMVTGANVVAFNRRYNPMNQQFKQIVDGMRQIYYAECQFYRNNRHYQNFITATGIHGINYMEYLFGPIETVTTDKWKNPVHDTNIWVSQVTFSSGVRGLMKFFPCSGTSLERYEVHSNDISAYLHSPQSYTEDSPGQVIVYEKSKLQQVIRGDEDENPLIAFGFVDEYIDFFEACLHNRATISNFQNVCNSMKIAESIEKGIDI